MLNEKIVNQLRFSARKLVRELGILELSSSRSERKPQEWHALIEISAQHDITIAKLAHLLVLSSSSASRIVSSLVDEKLIVAKNGSDSREKYLTITAKGKTELKKIDEYSNFKIQGAAEFLSEVELQHITTAMQKYADALEKSREVREQIKIHTLSTLRPIRKQIVSMIENIQVNEFSLPITSTINACILKAEEDFYFNKSYNFWYAIDHSGAIIGSIGLKKIDKQNAEIKKFFVDKNYRGKGVAQKLLSSLTKTAAKHGFKHLYLGCVLETAQAFYTKYGFEKIARKELPTQFERCELDTTFFRIKISDLQSEITNKKCRMDA